MSEVLVEITRGPIAESIQRGDVAVCNAQGELLAYAGDPEKLTYMRSAAKPIQALNVFVSGAQESISLTRRNWRSAVRKMLFHQRCSQGKTDLGSC